MIKINSIFFALILMFNCVSLNAQNKQVQIVKNLDLSNIWMNTIDKNEDISYYMLCEPLGFIGTDYQRFYIHYNSIMKNKTNALLYDVIGKTKVKGIICDFKGTINVEKVESVKVDKESGYGASELIKLTCSINYNENKNTPNTGSFSGKMISYIYLDENNKVQKGSIGLGDGECFNQTKTNWTSYKSGIKKQCNWGENRIPNCGDLDNGAGEFYVNPKYVKYGWQSFYDRQTNPDDKSEKFQSALKEEEKMWWSN